MSKLYPSIDPEGLVEYSVRLPDLPHRAVRTGKLRNIERTVSTLAHALDEVMDSTR